MSPLFAALLLGIVAGLRAFTAPAVLLLARGYRVAGLIVAALAVAELAGDLRPNAPSRTVLFSVVARVASGAFVGWLVIRGSGANEIMGACIGVAGALIGTFGGYALRMRAIAGIGAIPAAISEDVIAIGLALAAVLVR